MNRVCLIGRLTRNPELKQNESGKKQTTFTLAVARQKKDEADFINCIAWDIRAETICKYLTKGRELGIEGRLNVSNYEDKEGNKRYATSVIVDNLTFIGSKEQAGDKEQDIVKEEVSDPFKDFGDEVELTDEDLPF